MHSRGICHALEKLLDLLPTADDGERGGIGNGCTMHSLITCGDNRMDGKLPLLADDAFRYEIGQGVSGRWIPSLFDGTSVDLNDSPEAAFYCHA